MLKKFWIFLIFNFLLITSPLFIRYLLIKQKFSFLNGIYFNYPALINRKKSCPGYSALLNQTLDSSFSVSIINDNGLIIGSYNDEVLRIPASNQKLISSAYVLSKYKLKNTLRTSLLRKDKNNYYLVGQGDPDLNYSDYNQINFKCKIQ